MKDKNVAGILALFLGWAGIHRFYLGQTGLGIFYCLMMIPGISFILGIIDAVAFFLMDEEQFDRKYNRARRRENRRTDFDREDYSRRRQKRDQRYEEWQDRQQMRRQQRTGRPNTASRPASKANPYKQRGIQKYKEYDYKGAIEDFEKALEMDERDIAVHFNLACAYSLEENLEKSIYHLDKAVGYGFKDFDKIRKHDAFAFIRIQKEYAEFEANKFRMVAEVPQLPDPTPKEEMEEDLLSTQPDLLDQLKKLGDLREKGLLTEEEFSAQKRKLLG